MLFAILYAPIYIKLSPFYFLCGCLVDIVQHQLFICGVRSCQSSSIDCQVNWFPWLSLPLKYVRNATNFVEIKLIFGDFVQIVRDVIVTVIIILIVLYLYK